MTAAFGTRAQTRANEGSGRGTDTRCAALRSVTREACSALFPAMHRGLTKAAPPPEAGAAPCSARVHMGSLRNIVAMFVTKMQSKANVKLVTNARAWLAQARSALAKHARVTWR